MRLKITIILWVLLTGLVLVCELARGQDPNFIPAGRDDLQFLIDNWLKPQTITLDDEVFCRNDPWVGGKDFIFMTPAGTVPRYRVIVHPVDPNSKVKIVIQKEVVLDLWAFCFLSQRWVPPEPSEPNWAEMLADVTDPNLAAAIREMMTK